MARFLFKDIEFPNTAQYGKATSVMQAGSFGESRQSKLKREEHEYAKRDFNPINGLIKTDSTSRLIEKHKDSLSKLHSLHKEAQDHITRKGKDIRYTVNSTETPTINNNYKEMQQ